MSGDPKPHIARGGTGDALPDDPHFISRHGGWFRPNAEGYTRSLADAGIFSGDEARLYFDVEGLTIHPLAAVRIAVGAEAIKTRTALAQLDAILAATAPHPHPAPREGDRPTRGEIR